MKGLWDRTPEDIFKQSLGCVWFGFRFAAMATASLVLGLGLFLFVSWGASDEPNVWFVLLRLFVIVWVGGTIMKCVR